MFALVPMPLLLLPPLLEALLAPMLLGPHALSWLHVQPRYRDYM